MLKKIFFSSVFMSLFISAVFMNEPAYAKLKGDLKKSCEAKLESILMNKTLIAKVTFPASNKGIDLKIDGTLNNKKITRTLKDKGIGIEIGSPATVTTVKLKDKDIEVHLNGGGHGTFMDRMISDDKSGKSGGVQSGGSRINLKFDRDITEEDIVIEKLAGWLEPVVETGALAKDIALKNIPEEFKEAAEKGEILVGMDKKTVFAIMGEPKEKKVDLDKTPPVEKWQYELKSMEIMVITIEKGKVIDVMTF
ncbi:hypothetical protein ACFL4P_01180 [Gemmatimonadota bacterium]